MTPDEMRRLRRELGVIPGPRRGRPPAQDPPDLVRLVRDRAAAGTPDRTIAEEIGRPVSSLADLRKRNNIPPGRPHMGRPRKQRS